MLSRSYVAFLFVFSFHFTGYGEDPVEALVDELSQADAKTAIRVVELEPQANAGDAAAQLELARAYWAMVVMAKDDVQSQVKKKSWAWYEKAVEQTENLQLKAEATKELATNYWYQEKLDGLRGLAEKGVADAQYYLADRLISKEEMKDEAALWFEKAAENGHIRSIDWMVTNLQHGLLLKQDIPQAFEWLKKGAEAGDLDMMYALAEKYRTGFGSFWPEFQKDIRKANTLYQKAANAGHTESQIYLAKLLIYAKQGPNAEIVTNWLLEKEEGAGYFYRGQMYEKGIGRELNLEEAKKWYEQALDKGYSEAEYAIGRVEAATSE